MNNEVNIPLEEDGIEEEILVDEEVAITKAMWGDIGGNIENQTDLKNALDAKQDSLTESQLNAVNSGITSEKVTTYDGYADQIASKADQSALNAETIARGEADTALGTRIDNEALARQSADNGLQSQIDAITSKSDVVDVVANYAALQAYDTSTLGNNDVVKVLDDETHEDALTYYRWSTTTQTWSYIGQEAPYYSKGQMDVMLQGKQDKLTAGANIQIQNGTISATDTTYTAGNGLNLNGTEFSADTTVLATKEDLESYYTKPETDNLLAPKLEAEVVAELPTTGAEGKLYLTPKAHTAQTATGNPITATVAEDVGVIESFQLDGDTFQQSYEGKNLLMNKEVAQEKTGITITPNSDGSFTLDGTATATTDFYFAGAWSNRTISYLDMPSGDYTLSLLDSAKQQVTSPKFRIELYDRMGENSSRILWLPQSSPSPQTTTIANFAQVTASYISIPINQSFTNEKFYIQLEKGTTATDFEKFVGGQPSPNPDCPQPIQTVTGEQTVEIVGKNLFNATATPWVKNVAYNTAGQQNWDEYYGIDEYQPVEASTQYTFSNDLNKPFHYGIAYYNSSKTLISTTTDDTTTFTTPANCAYIRFAIESSTAPTWAQIELGSTASSYTPYSKQTLPISLGSIELCKLGAYQDYIYKSGSDWKIHKATASYQITGQESDLEINTFQTNTARFFSATALTATGAALGNNIALSVCNRLPLARNWSTDVVGIYVNEKAFVGRMNKTVIGTTVAEARRYFANNPTLICYQLATPTDTAITDQNLIAQLEAIRTASLQNGANTITNTATGTNLAGDMEIGYFGYNPRNRYDKWLWLDINNNYEQIGS